MKALIGMTALITGGSRGIGVYIARALAGQGMNLVLAARSADMLETVAAEMRGMGVRVDTVAADVGDRDQLTELVKRAEAASGGVDVLVNNAGLEDAVPYARLEPARIDQIIEVNLRAPMMLTRLFLPKMIARGRGHIVNIASLAGLMGVPYEEPYSATKHGLVGFTRSLRASAIGEGYPVGISVICPGFISEAGMYENARKMSGVDAPSTFGTSPPEAVAEAVVRAVVDDEPEIIVNAKPVRPLLLMQVFAPRMTVKIAKKAGALSLFKRLAHLPKPHMMPDE